MSSSESAPNLHPILFFDGECAFCIRSVRLLAALDRQRRLYFAPRKGETGERILPKELFENADSMIFYSPVASEKFLTHSDAVIMAITEAGGIWRLAKILSWIPSSIRDGAYRQIASRRHRLKTTGAKSCSLPPPNEIGRFLP